MYRKIMVPLDGSELAECVFPHLEMVARGCGATEVFLVRAVEPFHMPSGSEGFMLSEDEIRRIDAQSKNVALSYLNGVANKMHYEGVTVRADVVTGNVGESLADFATKNSIDLIIIATHGRSGVSRWVWGSVADKLLRSSCMPVLMVRVPGCVPGR